MIGSMTRKSPFFCAVISALVAWLYWDRLSTFPGTTGEAPPIIDMAEEHSLLVKQISHACEKWGFFQVVNHGIPLELTNRMDLETRTFFALPKSEKSFVKRSDTNPRGWFDDELTKRKPDWKEAFDVGLEGEFEIDGTNRWPNHNSEFKSTVLEYYDAISALSLQLMEIIAEGLELEPRKLTKEFENHTSFLRLNYYPVCDVYKVVGENWTALEEPDVKENGVLAINKHTDAGFLTVLRQRVQDPSSLQVLKHGMDKWIRVKPVFDSFTINVGDMLQVFSNDKYKSALHRVLGNTENARYSAPFFLNPNYSSVVQKLDSTDRPPIYKPFTWGEFRRKRFAGDFADTGYDDVQISQFKI